MSARMESASDRRSTEPKLAFSLENCIGPGTAGPRFSRRRGPARSPARLFLQMCVPTRRCGTCAHPSGPWRSTVMTRIFLAALALSLAARAEDKRIDAVWVDPTPAASSAPSPALQPMSTEEAPPRSPVLQTPQRSSDGFSLPFHVGVMAGLSVPRPLDGEIYVRALGFFQVGFSYSDFPAFVADPLLSAAGLKNGSTQVRLDQFSAWEADLRVFPFAGSFFLGSSIGKQSFASTVTETTTLQTYQGSVSVNTVYATPRI